MITSCLRPTPERRSSAYVMNQSTGEMSQKPRATLKHRTNRQVTFSDWVETATIARTDEPPAGQVIVSAFDFKPSWALFSERSTHQADRLLSIKEVPPASTPAVRFADWVENVTFESELPAAHSLKEPTLHCRPFHNLAKFL